MSSSSRSGSIRSRTTASTFLGRGVPKAQLTRVRQWRPRSLPSPDAAGGCGSSSGFVLDDRGSGHVNNLLSLFERPSAHSTHSFATWHEFTSIDSPLKQRVGSRESTTVAYLGQAGKVPPTSIALAKSQCDGLAGNCAGLDRADVGFPAFAHNRGRGYGKGILAGRQTDFCRWRTMPHAFGRPIELRQVDTPCATTGTWTVSSAELARVTVPSISSPRMRLHAH